MHGFYPDLLRHSCRGKSRQVKSSSIDPYTFIPIPGLSEIYSLSGQKWIIKNPHLKMGAIHIQEF